MIEAFGLTSNPRKAHPPAVDDVSFEARAGHVTALLGPVGAGKTTTLRLMLELQQGRGTAYFRGRPLHRIAHPSREVGVLLGDVPGHPARSVRGHLRMLCAAAGVPVRRADEVLEVVGLASFREERVGTLSRGMDRRLGLACTLLPDPHTLVLDEPTEGLSPREQRWLHGMLRAHAQQGGTVLFTTADPKEAARTADRVVTLDGGRLLADQEGKEFARTRLRPRVAVRSPHAARLAALLAKEARAGRRSVEVVREGGNRLSVYGSTTADVGEIAFRNGILVHQLADEVGDMGPASGTEAEGGAEPSRIARAAAHVPAGETTRAAGERPQRKKESAAARSARAVPGPSAGQRRGDGDERPEGHERQEERPAAATPAPAAEPQTRPMKRSAPVVPGPAAAEGTRSAISAVKAQDRHPEAGQDAPGESSRTSTATAGESPDQSESAGQSEPQPGPRPSQNTRPEPEDDTLAVVLALCADEPDAEKTAKLRDASRAAKAPSASDESAFGPRPGRHPGTEAGHRPSIQAGHNPGTEVEKRPGSQTGPLHGSGTGHRAALTPAPPSPASVELPTSPLRSSDAHTHPNPHREPSPQADPHPAPNLHPAGARGPAGTPHPVGTPEPASAPGPSAPRPESPRSPRPAGPASRVDPLSALPPPISVRPAPSPLRPLRYELRRAGGIGTGFLACGAALAVSALTAVLLARLGHTPQARLFAAWPRELPLPPTALVAGLLGALAFGDEFRHPALAADRGTVPRRLGLLTAKLAVCGATALLLAFLTVGCDAEVLYLVYGRETTQVPTDWLSLTAAWFGLVLGCAWAGVLAAGVFRSTMAGLAAVLAVPVVVVPLVHTVLKGSAVRDAAGFSLRTREVLLSQWPFGGERYLAGLVRIIAQPVGGALTLSLTALLCAYLFTTLRARAR
ncbi:ATP-binding cassette domain-containing protein [Streptomyces sp. L2]|uniref:ATP-binding cassette domain-containing protein n=1 Tax=Streptomyces sp. L2 TaxID=2162665 RepID=UPI0010118F22|nr:ATP-binding cassette domain-containing protein [Streptomyces sp. L2]